MNWKLRLKNKATLIALIGTVVTFVYQILGIFNVVPPVSQDQIIQIVGLALNILVGLGVIVDPTTKGVGDSALAKSYGEPADKLRVYDK